MVTAATAKVIEMTPTEIYVPSDIREFGERHKIPEFANATYRNGYVAGWRAALSQAEPAALAGQEGETEIIAPAECDENCDDPDCPYSHKPLTLRQAYENAVARLRALEAAAPSPAPAGVQAEPEGLCGPVPTHECGFRIGQPVRLAHPYAEDDPDAVFYVTGITWEHRMVPARGWNIMIAGKEDIEKGYGQTDGFVPDDLLPTPASPVQAEPADVAANNLANRLKQAQADYEASSALRAAPASPRMIPTEQEMNQAFYVDVCRAEDRLKEFVSSGRKLLDSLPEHWHGEAESELRDLCDETHAVLAPHMHTPNEVEQATKRYGKPASPASPSKEWEPIETAPKDGTEVLITTAGAGMLVRVGYWDDANDGAWWTCSGKMRPTHWKPLPAAPTGTASPAGEGE